MVSYAANFYESDFTDDAETGKKKLTISAETLNMAGGMDIRLSKLLRNTNGQYENVIAAYKVDGDGNLHIYSDEAFIGRYVVCNDI